MYRGHGFSNRQALNANSRAGVSAAGSKSGAVLVNQLFLSFFNKIFMYTIFCVLSQSNLQNCHILLYSFLSILRAI